MSIQQTTPATGRSEKPQSRMPLWMRGGIAAILLFVFGYLGFWQWVVCRVWVPPGKSLMVRYKGPFPPFIRSVKPAPDGTLVQVNSWGQPESIGVLEQMPGPGRHFYSPLEYEVTLIPDTIIKPGEIGVVTSKVGQNLKPGEILTEEDGYKGIRRAVLTPGRYRLNVPYAYEVKVLSQNAAAGPEIHSNSITLIEPGYVGVVTNRVPNKLKGETQGIQEQVLQPGIYYINPEEKTVDIISIGYNETSLTVMRDDPNATKISMSAQTIEIDPKTGMPKLAEVDPKYKEATGISFPSSDGFQIYLDYTAIWGILPDQAPGVIRNFGNLKDVEKKVIETQIGSICRLEGSKRGAVQLLVGDSREAFQTDTAEELEAVLKEKNLTLLFGLMRHIYVPAAVREPIQRAKLADELRQTRDQQQMTAQAQATLTEAKAKVVLEEKRTEAETEKLVNELIATGNKQIAEISAETEKLTATIAAQTATVQAKITTTIGEADAKKVKLRNEAEAERFQQFVQALGGPEVYNRYLFAEKLPEDLDLRIFYAGPGTFWTDLHQFDQALLGKMASEQTNPSPGQPKAARTAKLPAAASGKKSIGSGTKPSGAVVVQPGSNPSSNPNPSEN